MRTYWNTTNGLRTIDTWEPNCWVQVTCPTQEDVNFLENELKIPDYYISDIADTDERARYDIDEGWILIILRIPYVKETRSRTPYTTIPLGIIMKGDVLITVCNFETNMMIDFVTYQQKRGLGFTDQAKPRQERQQCRPHQPQPFAGQSDLFRHFHPRQRKPALEVEIQTARR